jgi:hypothetical protein
MLRFALIAPLFFTFTLATAPVAAQRTFSDPSQARLITDDIPRFWAAFDARNTLGSARAFDSLYMRPGSRGLRDWTKLRLDSAGALGRTVDWAANYYTSARASTLRIRDAEPAIRASFDKLASLYADARFPDVYFLIGRLSSGGTTSDAGLLIGAEMYGRTDSASMAGLTDWLRQVLRPVEDVPGIVAHELVHFQQGRSGRTLLDQSLREGSADFIGEMLSGMNINAHVHAWVQAVPGRERDLWTEFQRVMDGTSTAGWFSSTDVRERPKDLGYYMGCRIARAYYENASDKR